MVYEKIAEELKKGKINDVKELVQKAIDEGHKPKDIISNALMKGMSEVGVLFKNGEIFVPEVLIASKAMSAGMELVKPLLLKGDVESKGKCVFATVKGDLHDIGKKLVAMMLENAGFEIIDLGTDVSPDEIVNAVKKHNPKLVGMSAMLTTTMKPMQITVEELKRNGLYDKIKVMIGGAPVTEKFANSIGAYYSNDASSAVDLANSLMSS